MFRPAFLASAVIPAGVMSGVPTICSCLRLSLTVDLPLTPITIAAMPNAIRTAAASTPPSSNTLRMSCSFRRGRPSRPLLLLSGWWNGALLAPSGFPLNCIAGIPLGRDRRRGAADDEHRPARFVQHAARDAAKQCARDRAVPARADDDQLGVDRVRVGHDLVDGVAAQHRGPRLDASLLGELHRLVERAPVVVGHLVRDSGGPSEA